MKAIICDKCKKILNNEEAQISISILKYSACGAMCANESEKKDFCQKCYDKIKLFIVNQEEPYDN